MTEAEFEKVLTTGNQEELIAVIERIIKDYAAVLGREGAILRDVRDLPSPKAVIAIALLAAIKVLKPGPDRENLRTLFIFLSNFQSMNDDEKSAIRAHWSAVMSISNQQGASAEALRDHAQTITDTGDVVSRFQAMSNTEADTLRAQLRVAE